MMISLVKCLRLLACAVMALLIIVPAHADDEKGGRVPLPNDVEGKGEQCVEPVDVMRHSHMNFILHQRDETMYQGVRTKQHSLKECINCHVQPTADGNYPSIKSNEHFCSSCHIYAAVKIDCFECHATRPEGDPGAVHHPGPGSAKTKQPVVHASDRTQAARGMAQ